ncbi:MAG: hypothetical protein HYW62_00875 [Candidatus Levybacteria bacterium]|nr:hypothetical protein [Candidatus Levybacteria bacterium]
MRRRRHTPLSKRFEGTHFSDPFLEWLKGFTRKKLAIKDVTKLSNEVLSYRHELFPVRSVPMPENPGYVRYNRDFFTVRFHNEKVNKDLTAFFSEDRYGRRIVSNEYGHDLADFFTMAFHGLLVNGVDVYAIEWDKVKINKRYYTLPIAFHWINPATLHINENDNKRYLVQKFSSISKFIVSYYEYKNHIFSKAESLIFNYPASASPVSESLKYLKKLSQGMDFSLIQGKANIEPKNYSLELEKARYRSSAQYWRQQNMTRVKVRRIFNQSISGFGVALTTYYEVYAYAEYKKHLNIIRDYFISQFNNQIMELIREKNGFATPLQITYQGFTSSDKIDSTFLKYKEGKISVDEFIDELKDSYDTNTF